MPTEIDNARYVSFTSYKKDGTPVPLPVWVVPFDGGYAFTTEASSFKMKRIARDPRATLRVCDMRGRVADGATEYVGAAVALHGDDAATVAALVKQKYRIGWAFLAAMDAWRKVMRRNQGETADCAIKVTLHD